MQFATCHRIAQSMHMRVECVRPPTLAWLVLSIDLLLLPLCKRPPYINGFSSSLIFAGTDSTSNPKLLRDASIAIGFTVLSFSR